MSNIPDSDFQMITRRVFEYAYGIDLRDWSLYRSIFTDQVHIDFSSYSGTPAAEMAADAWVQAVKPQFTGLTATQHTMTNPLVDITGDEARCRMYMQAEHFLDTEDGDAGFAIGGYYDDKLVRTQGSWKICAVKLTVFWRRGNAGLMNRAREIGLKKLAAQLSL